MKEDSSTPQKSSRIKVYARYCSIQTRRFCRPPWQRVSQWYRNIWRKSKSLTLIGSFFAICILFFLCLLSPVRRSWNVLIWLLFGSTFDSRHGYIVAMFLFVLMVLLCLVLTRLFPERFRKEIAIPLQKWIAPEFPMRGIATAVFLGILLAMIGLTGLPAMLKAFGWTQITNFAAASVMSIAPVTTLVWYWRHVYKKREREHSLLTLATTSLADPKSPSVRITGLYTLKELVEANPAKLIDVMNILCGFLKHRYYEEEKEYRKQGHDYKKLPKIDFGRAPDIREALNIFSRIWQDRFDDEEKYRTAMKFAGNEKLENYIPDLHGVNFLQTDLSDLCLQQVNLTGSNLQEATLWNANLLGAVLQKSELQGANLCFANLQGASLQKSNLQEAHFHYANLQGAVLKESELQGAHFHYANLQGAVLKESELQGANLCVANLQGVDLQESNLQGSSLWATKIGGVNFESARLHGTTNQFTEFVSLAHRVGEETEMSWDMLKKAYSQEEVQPTIDKFQKIYDKTSDKYTKNRISLAIDRLQDGVGRPPEFPEPDDSEHCGVLTLDMALDILKKWPEKMRQKELEILKERGFDVPDQL